MGTYTLIKDTSIKNYNKAERLNLLKRFMALMPGTTQGGGGDDGDGEGGSPLSAATEGVPALNISAEQVEQMNTLIDQMSELTMQATSAAETPEMQQLEADRDVAANYIVRRIADYDRLPLATEREAARRLEPVVRPYAGIASLPVSQETEVIRGLAADLAKPDLADDVTTLGLAPYIAEMQRLNEAYAQLAAQRPRRHAGLQTPRRPGAGPGGRHVRPGQRQPPARAVGRGHDLHPRGQLPLRPGAHRLQAALQGHDDRRQRRGRRHAGAGSVNLCVLIV